jgi:hypothetical protein
MDSPVLDRTEPSDAIAITSIFEEATGYALTDNQREQAQNIMLQLTRHSTVMDFVSLADELPALREFSSAVRNYFVDECSPFILDED